MKLLILHLSDIHFEKEEDYSSFYVDNMVKAIPLMKDAGGILIIVSGDISYSGFKAQYKVAEKFFSELELSLKTKFDGCDVKIVIVPGNHDINYGENVNSYEELVTIRKNNTYQKYEAQELNKMNAFYSFSKKYSCFTNGDRYICIRNLTFGDTTIRLNLINTSPFSSMKDEDQGMHYLPNEAIDALKSNLNCDYSFSIMHHPHHWFCDQSKKRLEAALYEYSDVLFVGHEHYSSEMGVCSANSNVRIFAGGELCNKGNWEKSEFYCAVLDTENREYTTTHFIIEPKKQIYVGKEESPYKIFKNRKLRNGLAPDRKFMQSFLQDTKYSISDNLTDYFICPLLIESNYKNYQGEREISEINVLIERITEKQKVIISGRSGSGKTMLLKQLFQILAENKYVIFISGGDIMNGNIKPEQIIRNAFEDIYSKDHIEYVKFMQTGKTDKAIIIDDVDKVSEGSIEIFERYLVNSFDLIILTKNHSVEFDLKERIRYSSFSEYTNYHIDPFYADKRKSLVTKVVNLLPSGKEINVRTHTIDMLCDALSKQRSLFNMDPDFIVQFTKYYCTIGDTVYNDGNTFSIVFESNIASLLKPNTQNLSVDKILIVLDKIAYYIHTSKEYPISERSMLSVIDEYNRDYDSDIVFTEFVNILQKSRIIAKLNNGFCFTEQSYLAYFVAREIKRKCTEEKDFSEFKHVLNYCCFNINADILLFVTYITDNLILIKMIMDKVEECTKQWEEFQLPTKIPYLANTKPLQIKTVTEDEREHNEKQVVEQEKKQEKENGKSFIAQEIIYSYDESSISLMDELARTLSLSFVLSRALPSFEHMMKKDDKERRVQLIYSSPLKIFNIWASEVQASKAELINEIKGLNEWIYRKKHPKKSADDIKPMNDSDAEIVMRIESESLLLELMNTSMVYATKPNTYKYIDNFGYEDKLIYRIEHLMSLDKRDASQDFVKEVEKTFKNQKDNLAVSMIQRVARHYIVTSKKMQQDMVNSLNAKLFKSGSSKTKGLLMNPRTVAINRSKNSKRN